MLGVMGSVHVVVRSAATGGSCKRRCGSERCGGGRGAEAGMATAMGLLTCAGIMLHGDVVADDRYAGSAVPGHSDLHLSSFAIQDWHGHGARTRSLHRNGQYPRHYSKNG